MSDKSVHFVLPEILAPRHMLLNAFYRAAARRMVFVQAPGGCGKTISTHLWLADSGRQAKWLLLGSRHNQLAEFYRDLAGCVAELAPEQAAPAELAALDDFGLAPVENMEKLVTALSADQRLYALVIDDFHLIDNREIHKSLLGIVLKLPHNFSVFILSRQPMPVEWDCLEETLPVIDKEQLAFMPEETAWYFRACGRELLPAEVSQVQKMTSGWAMGVGALAMSGSVFPQNGQHQVVSDYLNQVWQKMDADSREFLLRTSVVEYMVPRLCDLLTGRNDSAEVLERLCAEGSFIISTSSGQYRCHHIFQEYLLHRLENTNHLDSRELYRIAARYYRRNGRLYEGLRCAAKGYDHQGVAESMLDLYQYSSAVNSVAEHASRLKGYLLDLVADDFLEDNPFLLVNHIWYHYLMGNSRQVLHYLDLLYERFADFTSRFDYFWDLGVLISTLDSRKPPYGILLEVAHMRPRNRGEVEVAQSATLTENMPLLHRGNRDYSFLALDLEKETDKIVGMFAPIIGAATASIYGSGLRAGILYEQNLLNQARNELARYIAAITPATMAEIKMPVGALSAAVCYAEGKKDEFDYAIARCKQKLERENAVFLMPNLLAMEMKFRLMDGSMALAREWLNNYFVTEPEQPEFYKFYQHLATARAYMVLGRAQRAVELLRKLRDIAVNYNRVLDKAECEALLAALYWVLGEREQSAEMLLHAVKSTFPYNYIRVYADEGAALLGALSSLAGREELGEDYSAYLKTIYIAAYATSKQHRGVTANLGLGKVKLSRQQARILRLLAQGMTHKEIAGTCGLALPTVKGHAYELYKKLGVNSALDAVVRARDLALLD